MGVIQKQGIQSALITYSGIAIGFLSLLVVQPALLKPEEIGLTRILYSFSFLVSTLLPLSIGNITTRFFPRFRNDAKGHHGFYGLILIWLGLGCLIFLPFLWVFKTFFIELYSEQSALFSEYFMLVFPFSITIALISATSNYLSSCFKPIFPALAHEVIIRLLFIGLILLYAFHLVGFHAFVTGFLVIYLAQLFMLLLYGWKENQLHFRPDFSRINRSVVHEMIQYGWMVFLAGIASMAIRLIDVVVLGRYVSLSLTGVYAIAAFVPTFIEAPLNALDKVANARIAHSWEHNDKENIREIYYKSSRYLFLIGGILFLLVTLNAPHLFRWLPPAYMAGIPVIEILSLSAMFNLITGSNTTIIFASQKFYAGAIAIIFIALINFLLLLWLIPEWGLEGAAWATCISSFLYNIFKYLYILIRFKLQPFERRTLYIAGAILATYGAGNLLPVIGNVWLDLIITSLVVVSCYALFIWYSRAADDLKESLPILNRKK
jgi:O-antigen/teichoic acid export membrane protein